jgi:hypothetical protein
MRWAVSIRLIRFAFAVMPRGGARDRLGDLCRVWVKECEKQQAARQRVDEVGG